MAINYAEKYSAKVDERFQLASLVGGVINKDYDFVGVKTVKVSEKNGNLVCMKAVNGDEDLLVVTNKGVIIRVPLEQVKVASRNTQGVRIIKLDDNSKVSSIEVVEVLREAGCNVLGIASIFTYGLQKGLDRLEKANVINHSLSNFETLVSVAAEENYIAEGDIAKILKFQSNPSDPSWMDL